MSIEQLSVVELMKYYGFPDKPSVCHCDGYETLIYKKELIEVRWRKFKGLARIRKGRNAACWFKIPELQERLKHIFDVAVSQ